MAGCSPLIATVATLPVAGFTVGSPPKPSLAAHVQLVRRNGGVVFAWSRVGAASTYTTSIKTG